MNSALLGALAALLSSLSFGTGDFSGGFASRKLSPFQVLSLSVPAASILLIAAGLIANEPWPDARNLLIGGTAGILGTLGLALLFHGLATGYAAVVSPITGVMTAGIPALYSILTDGLPGYLTLVGFVVALLGIWLASQSATHADFSNRKGLGIGLAAGFSFGLFILLISFTDDRYLFWPLLSAKATTIPFILAILFWQGKSVPMPQTAPIALLAGALDAAGNAFYVLAQQLTRLDVAAVLSSMYPMFTVMLASWVLKEQVSKLQWLGVGLCVLAIALIAL